MVFINDILNMIIKKSDINMLFKINKMFRKPAGYKNINHSSTGLNLVEVNYYYDMCLQEKKDGKAKYLLTKTLSFTIIDQFFPFSFLPNI